MSKENLILTIKQNAERESERIVLEAQEECANRKSLALEKAQSTKETMLAEARDFIPVQESRIMTGAELEVRKIILKAKQDMMDKCFDEAIKKIVKMDDNEYIAIIKAMIEAEGQNGDEVIVSANDKSRLTASVISKIGKELDLKLKLSDEYGSFAGGIILRQNGCDKNMTIEMELSDIRDRFESKLSRKLFENVD